MFMLAATLLAGSAALGLSAVGSGSAAPKPACLSRPIQPEEQQFAELHGPWRNLYIPGSDPSSPLLGSQTLRVAALGIADDIAAGELAPGDVTASYLAERAIACGYPAAAAVGGRGIATGTDSADAALVLMSSEQWGAAANNGMGIKVPAWFGGKPMHCIGLAHASEGAADAWVVIIMAGEGASCPQALSVAVQPFDGGTPTATPSPPFTRPTKTPTPQPTATATPTATPSVHKLYLGIAKD